MCLYLKIAEILRTPFYRTPPVAAFEYCLALLHNSLLLMRKKNLESWKFARANLTLNIRIPKFESDEDRRYIHVKLSIAQWIRFLNKIINSCSYQKQIYSWSIRSINQGYTDKAKCDFWWKTSTKGFVKADVLSIKRWWESDSYSNW